MAYSGTYSSGAMPAVPPPKKPASRPLFGAGLDGKPIAALLQKVKAIDLDGDDLLMLLILYLMYRESGDKELLVMMGAMLLG